LPPKKKNINKMPPVQQKHHRLNSKRRHFALIQKLYKKKKGAAIRKILDGEWDTNDTEKPSSEKLEPYWRIIMERKSESDNRLPCVNR